eukprot:CAMPEP_0172153620 /NCGR_PEP_ID=MMETSP1050-20130122/1554_1 /TAXON_ID=233186 /ORGANISM="Cryptomonas curvata, Strain CCAP979/52" /LENGTH=227 /DNA_ID=CAMNT_0012822193 /DNA_START=355 /DNA_END=1035 /DNA_ORIENTATION=-
MEFNASITDHVIIFVNGIKAISSPEVEGNVFMQQLSAGAYRIDAMLGRYDELDGITSVLSNHVVEFFVDLQPPISRSISSTFTPYQPSVTSERGIQTDRDIIIFTYHCNRPNFVRMQANALRVFMQDRFAVVVINDAQAPDMRDAISDAARSVGAAVHETPDYLDHSDPGEVVGRVVTWSLQHVALRHYPGALLLLLEGDMFPVAPFSVARYMHGYALAGVQQGRRH